MVSYYVLLHMHVLYLSSFFCTIDLGVIGRYEALDCEIQAYAYSTTATVSLPFQSPKLGLLIVIQEDTAARRLRAALHDALSELSRD